LHKKVLHSIISFLLVIIFQLPSWMQLAHSFEDHDHIHLCDATGATKHIHQKSTENCSFLHQPVNYNFTFEIPYFKLSQRIDNHELYSLITSSFSLQITPFKQLRAPPFHFIS